MNKLILAVTSLLIAGSASAHQFWPDSYEIIKTPGASTMMITHLNTKEDGFFVFTLEGKRLGSKQLVLAGSNVDFPINIPAKYLQKGKIMVCSKQLANKDTMEKEVCLRIKVI